jgi:N-acyl homoserine lactone hydrolase
LDRVENPDRYLKGVTNMQVDGYEIDILIQGYPGRSLFHGGLGWCTVALIRGQGRVALIDTGSFGFRRLLIERLAKRGLKPAAVTDLLLTHADYDHLVNWTLFGHARIVLGAYELECALKAPWGETPVPELYVRELHGWPNLHTLGNGDEVFPGMTAHIAPGHTLGHMIFVLKGQDRDVIFTGDAVKNRGELISGQVDMTCNAAVSAASIDMVRELWRRRPGNILVPGHDLPMMAQEDGRIKYLGKREAAIKAWFGEDLETTTSFDLTIS